MFPPAPPVNPELVAALARATNREMSAKERFLQRVSFVYGQNWNGTRTKREVAEQIARYDGYPPEWCEEIE